MKTQYQVVIENDRGEIVYRYQKHIYNFMTEAALALVSMYNISCISDEGSLSYDQRFSIDIIKKKETK